MRGLNVAKAFTTEQRKQALIFPKRRNSGAADISVVTEMKFSEAYSDEESGVKVSPAAMN